jgi:FdhE protein
MNIGEEAKPPFAVLPDPSSLFLARSRRLAALAAGHTLEPYLSFLSRLTLAQHDTHGELGPATGPDAESVRQAIAHDMPPLTRAAHVTQAGAQSTIDRLLARLGGIDMPPETAAALQALRAAPAEERVRLTSVSMDLAAPGPDIAKSVLVAAGLQVHMARLASGLDADTLKPVADGVCPACGGPPMSSAVVGWPKAHNTRFCTCALCGTMWNVVRVKCVLCSSTAGISYHTIEGGGSDSVKAETCDKCRAYLKILYQVENAVLEPMADDVATLGLDLLMIEDGWTRGGRNPFLMGY